MCLNFSDYVLLLFGMILEQTQIKLQKALVNRVVNDIKEELD